MKKQVTLARGGSKEKTVDIDKINIPDMWHLASWLRNGDSANLSKEQRETQAEWLLKTWHIAHDFKRHIAEQTTTNIKHELAKIADRLSKAPVTARGSAPRLYTQTERSAQQIGMLESEVVYAAAKLETLLKEFS